MIKTDSTTTFLPNPPSRSELNFLIELPTTWHSFLALRNLFGVNFVWTLMDGWKTTLHRWVVLHYASSLCLN
ncbi:BgTH12-04485 [Blumeria graminis f. sp. triticale]|uniref:Bgt-51364 n=2 Tax=Blumeria graminis TaxID=34373 RepID=A0A9X9PQ83_BLUGR|nr:BgTH12-04485 [Blumeria graminis f. sp. triticale]VCU38934.1 Bgt-51364 [Blumeria graminis f. sp. tritici]